MAGLHDYLLDRALSKKKVTAFRGRASAPNSSEELHRILKRFHYSEKQRHPDDAPRQHERQRPSLLLCRDSRARAFPVHFVPHGLSRPLCGRLLRMATGTAEPKAGPDASLDEVERDHILRVLAESPTLEDAAETLGINVSTLWRKRKRYKID